MCDRKRRSGRAGAVGFMLCACLALATGCRVELPLQPGYADLHEQVLVRSDRLFEVNKLALIDIDGYIGSSGVFGAGGTSAADVKEKLRRAEEDWRLKGVLLRINSPGGEVNASDTIFREIRRFRRESGKPVVACLRGVGTSGAYYVALGADRIVITPATVTGSVGVVMQFLEAERLLRMIGVRSHVVKSGDKKDMGSFFREMQPEEREIFEGINADLCERFMSLVKQCRGLADEATKVIEDGRVLSAPQALELGLVDRIGGLDDALDDLKRLAGVRDADVVAYRPFAHYNKNIYAEFARGSAPRPGPVESTWRSLAGYTGPRFLYMWLPGR